MKGTRRKMKRYLPLNLRSVSSSVLRIAVVAFGIVALTQTANAQQIWTWQMVKCPLPTIARYQVNIRLGKLSRNLQDLASDKQELAETLSSGSREDVSASLKELEETVKRLRHNLDRITSILHSSDRQRGGEIADQVFQDLTQKNLVLQEARRKLNGGTPNMFEVRHDLEFGVKTVFQIKAKVDALITELANKPCP